MHIVYAFADSHTEWNTSEWRSHTPSNGLNESGEHTGRLIPIRDFAMYGNDAVQSVVGPADVIIVQRNLLTPEVWEACDYWRSLGKLVVADLDDDYPHLTPQNPAYYYWIQDRAELKKHIGKTPIEALTEGFRHVDALVSPNKLIIKDWEEVIPGFRGYWLPNYAHADWYDGIRQKAMPTDDQPIVIGWGGSISHHDSFWFSGLREAVPKLTEKYPRVMWKICGSDGRIKNMIEGLTGEGRWIDQPGVPPDKWPLQVASFDIGLAPLCGPGYPQGERYDLRRSWLKAVEYLLTGVPWVASGRAVYEELDGKGGVIVENTPEAWYDALAERIENLEEHKRKSRRLMKWARDKLTMRGAVEDYVAVFYNIGADKASRDKVRVPNVFYSADFVQETEEIDRAEVTLLDVDVDALFAQQVKGHELSLEWYKGLEMDYKGVDLGKCLQYPFLQTVNNLALEARQADD